MTCSNDCGENSIIAVDAAEPTRNISTSPHLNAIDMTNANKTLKEQDTFSENDMALFSNFQKMSMNESPTKEDVPEISFACGATRTTEANTSTAMSRTVHERANDSLLFLGDEDGDTPLHICIMQEDEVNSLHIINRAPDFMYLSVQNNLLQTPLHLAALTNGIKTVRKLICAGADVHYQDREGNTPLHIACTQGYLEIVKQLLRPITYRETLENKYPIPYMAIPQNMNVKNYDGFTCLHLAVLSQNEDILRLLLEAGADPNIGDSKSGRTPLHMAAEQGLIDCASLLISYRATEIDARNYAGHSPALLAYSRGHVTVAKLLVRYGASRGFYHCGNEHDNASDDEENMEV